MPQEKSVDFLFMVTLCLAWPKPPSQSGWTGNMYETTRRPRVSLATGYVVGPGHAKRDPLTQQRGQFESEHGPKARVLKES